MNWTSAVSPGSHVILTWFYMVLTFSEAYPWYSLGPMEVCLSRTWWDWTHPRDHWDHWKLQKGTKGTKGTGKKTWTSRKNTRTDMKLRTAQAHADLRNGSSLFHLIFASFCIFLLCFLRACRLLGCPPVWLVWRFDLAFQFLVYRHIEIFKCWRKVGSISIEFIYFLQCDPQKSFTKWRNSDALHRGRWCEMPVWWLWWLWWLYWITMMISFEGSFPSDYNIVWRCSEVRNGQKWSESHLVKILFGTFPSLDHLGSSCFFFFPNA